MKKYFGVYVNGLKMNEFATEWKALKLVASFAERGVLAVIRPLPTCDCQN